MSQGTPQSAIQGQEKPKASLVYARKFHKWLMAIIGVQLFIWSCTGLYMVLPNIHYIHGDHLVANESPNLYSQTINISFSDVLSAYPSANNVRLGWLGNKPVYRFAQKVKETGQHQAFLLDANTADQLPPLSKAEARSLVPHLLAKEYANTPIRSVILLTNSVPSEISARGLPLWQIELDTWDNTRLYVSQNSGELVSVRHHAWRLFDLFWRLHIMDYTEGEDISNTLLMLSSILAFMAALAGLIMLFFRLFVLKEERKAVHNSDLNKPRSSLSLYAKNFHKWLALLVFIQLFIWIVSGFLVGRLDANVASGRISMQVNKDSENKSSLLADINHKKQLASIDKSFAQYGEAQEISLKKLRNIWVYEIKHSAGRHDYWPSEYTLVDAVSSSPIEVNQTLAEAIALASYKPFADQASTKIASSALLSQTGSVIPKEQNAVWRVSINDSLKTQVYIRANTGKVIKHYNVTSEWKALLLKLHFMDYANEGGFNNIFSKVFASIALLLSFSGLVWLLQLLKEGQLTLARLKPAKNNKHLVKINNTSQLALDPNDTLLDALLEHNLAIDSTCAGGGMCGKCLCKVSDSLKPTHAERTLLSPQQLNENWRLSCQHRVRTISKVWLNNKNSDAI